MTKQVRKRDARIVPFNQKRITNAIEKAFKATGQKDNIKTLSDKAVEKLNFKYGKDGVPLVEEIQDIVEETLMEAGYYEVAKAYILYREQRKQQREMSFLLESGDLVESYLSGKDWRIKENANMAFSLQGLNNHLFSKVNSLYWLMRIYSPEIRKAHLGGVFHIHDLPVLGAYCVGWDLEDLLLTGFRGVPGKIATKPAKHLMSALLQSVNFMFTTQGETAGAQAFSSFDTYFAPFIRKDKLSYKQVVQSLQSYLFQMNVDTRVGFQCPFTNLTLDINVPKFMENEACIIGGKLQSFTYGDMEEEMEMFNRAYVQVMSEGDADGRMFPFPIITYNITEDFNWNFKELFELTAKYGTPYFSNFINSELNPEDVRSMCCRLRIDNKELRNKGGGFFGANPLTGSIGVVTINLPQTGYLSKDIDDFFVRLEKIMDIARTSLEIKRKTIEDFTERGLYPYSKFYLRNVKKRTGKYWSNHFSTIGLIGMNEACLNLLGENIVSSEGLKFSEAVLKFMRKKLTRYQKETGNFYNLEASPAEATATDLANIDKAKYPNIITASENEPFYTNSTQIPVDYKINLFEALKHQEKLQTLYTGGTVFHTFLDGKSASWESISNLVKKMVYKTKLSYLTITPTYSVCPTHKRMSGEHFTCPRCGSQCEVYSRIVGYYRPVQQWNKGKVEEFKMRKTFEDSIEMKVHV